MTPLALLAFGAFGLLVLVAYRSWAMLPPPPDAEDKRIEREIHGWDNEDEDDD